MGSGTARSNETVQDPPCSCGDPRWRWDSDLCAGCRGKLPSEADTAWNAAIDAAVAALRQGTDWSTAVDDVLALKRSTTS